MDITPRVRESGVALIAVILILALLMGLATALTTSVNMDTGLRGGYHRSTTGFYAAESGLNRGMGDYRNIFLGFNVPSGSDFLPKTITVGTRTVNYQITDVTAYDASGNPPSITIPPGLVFGGLNSIEYDYIDGSSAMSNSDTEARVNAEFKVGNIPLFQFVAFYTKDLEIAPGANMNLIGRIHTNGDLYLSADGALLSVVDDPADGINTVQVSAKGSIYRGRKRANSCDAGQVSVAELVDANHDGRLDPYGLNCNLPDSATPSSSSGSTREALSSELSTWKGSMINHVESIAVPLPDIDARGNGVYWTKADLRIVLNLTNTYTPVAGLTLKSIEVQDSAGNVDATKTANLRAFMLGTSSTQGQRWNRTAGKSSMPGTMPIYYTDVPTGCTDANATTCTNNQQPSGYNPQIGLNNDRVYGLGNNTMWPTPPPGGGTPTPTPTPTSTAAPASQNDYRRGGFYNWREAKWMYLLNVNLHDLLQWNIDTFAANPANALFDPSDRSDGGIVLFLSVQGPESNNVGNPAVAGSGSRYGVRLF
ncbi:MAG TPA: PilX N-terminal domain-containing pilus assembly protein, partial [Candidatus Kryptonia bacterium]|nr:PilX N-terminal domain-containing pilus assembly protein [Candidatus Kryptonia bacterium]